MIELQKKGYKCIVIYIVQRNDINAVGISPVDTIYYKHVLLAKQHGIVFLGYNCYLDEYGIKVNQSIKTL
jgi:DNA-binding sugar fermentation-stimulating protein